MGLDYVLIFWTAIWQIRLETKISPQGGEESAIGVPRNQGLALWAALPLNSEITIFGEDTKAFLIVKWTPERHPKTNLVRKEKKTKPVI